MTGYATILDGTALPVPVWALAVVWVLLLLVSQALAANAQSLAGTSRLAADPSGGAPPVGASLLAARVVFAAAVFVAAAYLDGASSVFLAGGLCVAAAVAVAGSIRNVLLVRARSQCASGTPEAALTPRLWYRSQAAELFSGAVLCLIIGLLLPHLAPLGAAFILAASSLGWFRKSLRQPR